MQSRPETPVASSWLQHYNAKLSDFGLAKNGPTGGDSHVTTRVMGTYGYAAPEYVATGTFLLLHRLNVPPYIFSICSRSLYARGSPAYV